MSEWIDKELFRNFKEEKKREREQDDKRQNGIERTAVLWPTPERGTTEKPKMYEGRFLPDIKGRFYMKYYYHMFTDGEKWYFVLCDKTFDFGNFCPWCTVTSRLYQGTQDDKKKAYEYKRKEKFVGNFYLTSDPRDQEREVKMVGTVRLYEFPGKIEKKLKEEITDEEHGLGPTIFDPGKDGYTFILKVLSTKPDRNKRVFPDYSSSLFARKPSALGNKNEIQEIMNKRYDLEEYIKSMVRPEEDLINLLKSEMVWELIEDDYKKAQKLANPEPVESKSDDDLIKAEGNWGNEPKPELEPELEPETETKSEPETKSDPETDFADSQTDLDDDELLQELENL